MSCRRSPALARSALCAAFTLALVGASGCQGNANAPAAGQRGAFGSNRAPEFSRLTSPPVAAPAATADGASPALVADHWTPPVEAVARMTPPTTIAPAAAVPQEELPAAAPAVDSRRRERELREDYATSTDPVGPALRLAGWLADRERHAEALFVLEQAFGRSDEPALRLAHAGLLRDTGRNPEAATELQAVVRDRQRHAIAPGTLLELAQVELLAGQRDQARRTYAELLQVVGDGDWYAAHGEELAQLRTATERPDGGFVSMRDLLALLRSAPAATTRVQLIERLLAPVPQGDAALEHERAALRERVLAIGCGDDSAAVRARTLRAAAAAGRTDEAFWRAALADDAPLVRSVAASAVVDVMQEAAAVVLLDRLDVEQDPTVFTALHRALESAVAAAHDYRLTPDDDAGRDAARAWWHTRCAR